MKTKNVFLIIAIILLFITPSFSQVSVGYKTSPDDGEGKFKPEDIAALKNSTLVFILPGDAEASDIKAYEKAFKDSWKLTPYKVITDDQLKSLGGGKYTYIILGGSEHTTAQGQNWTYCYYQFEMVNGKKEKIFAQIKVDRKYCFDKQAKGETPFNLTPGYLKAYLNIINSHLEEEKILSISDDFYANDLFKNLATETLYVPEENLHFISVNGGGKHKDFTEEQFFAKYPYPHKVASGKEISDILLNSDKPIYFMGPPLHHKFHLIISIYSSQSPNPVYYDLNEVGALDDSSMKKIGEKIKKLNK
jgi:hypothetical protein